MGKVGRNQACKCGSGKRYKHCCGKVMETTSSLSPEFNIGIQQSRREMEALRHRREQQQGFGRPIISNEVAGRRVVAVGKRLYHSAKWHTFHDFLREYLLGSLGPDWVNAEQAKPVKERHPILRWYAQAVKTAKELQAAEGAMISGPMTGAIQAFLNLGYNIYLIAHHGDGQAMADIYLRRLRSARTDDFIGALFETYAAAAFLKAGFELTYEETARHSTTCVEFVAKWPKTGECFSVEVKSRVHEGGPSVSDEPPNEVKRLRVGTKLVKALSKNASHTRVVMIEVNIPDRLTEQHKLEGWTLAALAQIRGNETAIQADGSLYPPAYVFVTNHSFHNDLNGTGGNLQALATGFRIEDFGPDVRYSGYGAVLAARERHSAMMALIESIKTHYEIPTTFNGELPGSLFASGILPPLRIGQRYLIPDGDGGEVAGRLISATVEQETRLAYGIYELADGRKVIATNPLSEQEIEDYRRYPATYFGVLVNTVEKAHTFVEKCDFLFNTYQHSTREKLLGFLANASDLENLRTLEQRELAIIFCERMANSMQTEAEKSKKSNEFDPDR
ncbi:MAG: hypothetical protein EON58_12700 [Alphaproteobacteria bacterium]|nr:MAG: hypothetical protein EON58_12700 [Alphaproteobacteria bacterium]